MHSSSTTPPLQLPDSIQTAHHTSHSPSIQTPRDPPWCSRQNGIDKRSNPPPRFGHQTAGSLQGGLSDSQWQPSDRSKSGQGVAQQTRHP
jgi:hypothetical protein